MAKERAKTKKKDGKKTEPLGKYRATFPEKVKWLIIEGGAINKLGHPAWGLIEKLLGVTNKTILQWRILLHKQMYR